MLGSHLPWHLLTLSLRPSPWAPAVPASGRPTSLACYVGFLNMCDDAIFLGCAGAGAGGAGTDLCGQVGSWKRSEEIPFGIARVCSEQGAGCSSWGRPVRPVRPVSACSKPLAAFPPTLTWGAVDTCDTSPSHASRRGLPYHLARQVAEVLTEKDVIRAHARDELGIDIDELANPLQVGVRFWVLLFCLYFSRGGGG